MNILRRYGFPRLLMPSNFALPPVDHCRGTSPSPAANSRPFLKAAPFPMADTTAVETSAPTPGISHLHLYCVSAPSYPSPLATFWCKIELREAILPIHKQE